MVDTTRREVVEIFETHVGLEPEQAKDLEIGIYNSSIDCAEQKGIPLSWASELFREIYACKTRQAYANLNKESYIHNDVLLQRLQEGEFPPHEVAAMRPEDMFPEKWREIINREFVRSKNAYEVSVATMSDRIFCRKCKKNKVSYIELQIRSADEPQTTFYTCLTCGYRWKH